MKQFSWISIGIILGLDASTDTLADNLPARNHDREKRVYIVQLKEPTVAGYRGGIAGFTATSPQVTGARRLNALSPASKSYARFLKERHKKLNDQFEQTRGRKFQIQRDYQYAFNGFATELTPGEANILASMPGVLSVTREVEEQMTTDAGPEWIGAKAIWGMNVIPDRIQFQLEFQPPLHTKGEGEGVVVAVLDSGVNSDHPSFADIGGDGYDHTNPLGAGNYIPGSHCENHPDFCNDKLIGAWGMVSPLRDPIGPEDSQGHGSHTASTAVGNVLPAITIGSPTIELTRSIGGVAPHANLIVYDVCDSSCPVSAILSAIEQVIIDASTLPNGIQVLNYSISGGRDPYNDPIELAFLNATAAGIFVSTSAGNNGPEASSNNHNGPWLATVAATTHNRKLSNSLVDITSDNYSDRGSALKDIQGVGFTRDYGPAPLIYAGDFPTDNGSANDDEPGRCLEPFPAGHFQGEIVICDRGGLPRITKGENVLAGGAGGLVMANESIDGDALIDDRYPLPAVHIGYNDGENLKAWLAAQPPATARISGLIVDTGPNNGDLMAASSSRGPSANVEILKPDMSAPGVEILAAFNSSYGAPAPEFDFVSGTSMSSPHNAGAAALISAVRPEWSPYAIKSALMMTAKSRSVLNEDGVTPALPFETGAGRIDLNRVLRSGLILDEAPENFFAANPADGGDPKTLNIASMQHSRCLEICSWTRIVTSTSRLPSDWRLYTTEPENIELSVAPDRLRLDPGESATIAVTATVTPNDNGYDWQFGELVLAPQGPGSGPDLHMPIAVMPIQSTD